MFITPAIIKKKYTELIVVFKNSRVLVRGYARKLGQMSFRTNEVLPMGNSSFNLWTII